MRSSAQLRCVLFLGKVFVVRGVLLALIGLSIPSLVQAQLWTASGSGSYPGNPGTQGSDALIYSSTNIVEWANGFQQYNVGSPALASPYTTGSNCLGIPAGASTSAHVTNLGEYGSIVLTFPQPIVANGVGDEFAVFSNGLATGYCKLGQVLVSQDDVNWFEEPNYSYTPGTLSTYSTGMVLTNIEGYSGKYPAGYGEPFSIDYPGFPSTINFVKIADVQGDGTYFDSTGNVIYDNYPGDDGTNVAGVGVLSAAPEPGTTSLVFVASLVACFGYTQRRKRTSSKPPINCCIILLATALLLSNRGPLHAQTPIAAINNIPGPGNANSFGTSLRYSSTGQLYAWDGQSVSTLSGTTFNAIGSAPSNNSADPGPINFSQNGQTIFLSNGSGGALGYSNPTLNGLVLSMAGTGGSTTQLSGSVPYTNDFIPVPAASTLPNSGNLLFVNAGNSSYTASTVSIFNTTTGADVPVITNIPGGSTSLAFNPANNELYVGAGYGAANQGTISSFPLSALQTAFTNNAALDFTASGTVFNTNPGTGPTTGDGMFFDAHGYLFSGGDGGITVFAPNGKLVDQLGQSSDFFSITYNPAADQVLAIDEYNSPNIGSIYRATDFEVAPEPGTLVLLATCAFMGAVTIIKNYLRVRSTQKW